MRYSIAVSLCALAAVVCSAGCTHTQLRRNTVRQSQTLTDIYEQQVLDNLAMFVYDPNSLPFFSFPNAGASNVEDKGEANGMAAWMQGGLDSAGFGLNASRSMNESWTLTPIIDPLKLQLMRCAYQQVVQSCGRGEMSMHCPNCVEMREAYLGKNPEDVERKSKESPPEELPPGTPSCPDQLRTVPDAQRFTKSAASESANRPGFPGTVDHDCLYPRCWIGSGCKKCIPKRCKCLKVGHYCGLYVWVLPGGQDELTKLTLNVLNYAFNDPTPQREKEVTWYMGKDGSASNSDAASIVAKAIIPFREPVMPFSGPVSPTSNNIFRDDHLRTTAAQPSPIPSAGYLQFQQQQRFLTPR